MKKIKIIYFAKLREDRGQNTEELQTESAVAADLYRELAARHGFSLGTDAVRVSVNGVYAAWDTPLSENDEIVFIPPVAGG